MDEHRVHAPQQVVRRRHQGDLASFRPAVLDPLKIRPNRRRAIHALPGGFHQILAGRGRQADRSVESLRVRFPKYELWERGEATPTLKQLEAFAKTTYVPMGYLFLPRPPEERIPIPDLRTVANRELGQPSPNLLDTIYLCQQRQVWYPDYARAMGERARGFVGSVRRNVPIEQVAEKTRRALEFHLEARRQCGTWTEALRLFIEQADDLGVLVMCSGVVGSNNRRTLDTEELARLRARAKSRGGDFFLTLGARASKRFARALVVSTLEGQSSFTEAFRLLGLRKMETFRDLGIKLMTPYEMLRRERARFILDRGGGRI
jgi:transcriptional regulator with XRE-family HTH domain